MGTARSADGENEVATRRRQLSQEGLVLSLAGKMQCFHSKEEVHVVGERLLDSRSAKRVHDVPSHGPNW